ncbi:MAG: hypothetical protein NTY61_03490 [Candidatus Parcubacteria bacterium]|nr:hypothetical protein [Candidatus Parcubacteria bacterium]
MYKILKIIGECIYCRKKEGRIGDEHIIPYSLGGGFVLKNASCEACETITSKFERDAARWLWVAPRAYLKLPTRRKQNRKQNFPIGIEENGQEKIIYIPIAEYGLVIFFHNFFSPAYITKKKYGNGISCRGLVFHREGGLNLKSLGEKYHTKRINFIIEHRPCDFARLIAKIAYGFAVAEHGLEKIEDVYVLPAILNQIDDIGRWVGCDADFVAPVSEQDIYVSGELKGREIFVRVRIFNKLKEAPTYLVVVGKLKNA